MSLFGFSAQGFFFAAVVRLMIGAQQVLTVGSWNYRVIVFVVCGDVTILGGLRMIVGGIGCAVRVVRDIAGERSCLLIVKHIGMSDDCT